MTRLPMLTAPPTTARAGELQDTRVALVHLGCPKNLVDSEHMLAAIAGAGATLTGDPTSADVLVVNTCAFIDGAKAESVERILEAEQWKKERSGRRLVVAGCLAERYADDLESEIPAIDALVGTGGVLEVVAAIGGNAVDKPGAVLPAWLPTARTPRILTTATHTAYLKLSEGCDHTCSFCIIPHLRGQHRSRPLEDLVAEATSLAEMGVKELNLIAQDSTSYGEDLGVRDGLAGLIRALGAVDGLEWVRVHYAYPTRVTDAFLDALAETDNACKYIDIPLQHANRAVLQAMRRGGDGASLLRLLERIRSKVPGVSVRTTFIVGFPNETEKRYQELVEFVRAAQLERVGVFTYSHEEETTAHALRDRVPAAEKERRKRHLMRVQARISGRKNRALVGSRMRALIDAVQPDRDLAWARLEGQAPEIDGRVRIRGAELDPGELVDIEIVDASAHDLDAVVAP